MSDFDEWLAGLRSDDYDTVVQSAAALGRSGDHRAVEPLLSLLTDESRFDASRSCAAEALGELGELAAPEASGALHACIESRRAGLADEEWPVLLVNCAVALAKYGDHSAAGDVVDALRSPILTARSLAADGLRVVTGPGDFDALAAALRDDESREVRRAVIEPLFLHGTADAARALVAACDDPVDDVAMTARTRLGDLIGEQLDYDDAAEEADALWRPHEADFATRICHRFGRPLRVLDVVSAVDTEPNRWTDLTSELTVITGLPVGELLETGGATALRARVAELDLADGGYFKWGRQQPL